MHPPHRIYGIDFNGAQDGGKKIWIAEGLVKGASLLIEDCFKARKKIPVSKSIRVIDMYGNELQSGAIVTAESGRIRIRPPK